VLLVDDSPTVRLAFKQIFVTDPELEIVGEARNGFEALQMIPALGPDIVLMDIVMPGLDGLETTRELMARFARPVLIISEKVGGNPELSFAALQAGALEVIGKPSATQLSDPSTVAVLRQKVKRLAEIPVITRRRPGPDLAKEPPPPAAAEPPPLEKIVRVCIGTSTGGPPALNSILRALPESPRWPVLVVQHMTPGFIGGMVRWLQTTTGKKVELAADGVMPLPGTVYVAGDHQHLEIRHGVLRLSDSPPMNGHRPSVDALFASVAREPNAASSIGVILTGMGGDGSSGLAELRASGGYTVAQDRESCVVYGMPRAAVERGAVTNVLPLEDIAALLARLS